MCMVIWLCYANIIRKYYMECVFGYMVMVGDGLYCPLSSFHPVIKHEIIAPLDTLSVICPPEGRCEGGFFFFSFINILNILILHSFTEKLLIWHFGDFLMWISIYPVNGAKRRDPWKIYCNLCDTRFWCALQLEIIATQKAIWHIIAQFAMILTGEMYNHHHYA